MCADVGMKGNDDRNLQALGPTQNVYVSTDKRTKLEWRKIYCYKLPIALIAYE